MRRALVLTDESARHPYRASLPPHSTAIGEVENRRSWRLKFGIGQDDLREFATTYCAAFLAVSVFIA